MSKSTEVDSKKLSELLSVVGDSCLMCPAPIDYNTEEYNGTPCPAFKCPAITCSECWGEYIKQPTVE